MNISKVYNNITLAAISKWHSPISIAKIAILNGIKTTTSILFQYFLPKEDWCVTKWCMRICT